MSEDIQIRAARAEQLLEDETLQEALDSVFKEALDRSAMADLSNAPDCVAAVAALQAVGFFQDKLKGYITAGKAAERKPYKVA